ncbi:TniQ family protein [Paracoccus pacificus]|uniref:TniQ family protein n=1 Tax=Paracoccus pacificus TaxID=1463598 RepID=A0ABW4R7F3_9RHOB
MRLHSSSGAASRAYAPEPLPLTARHHPLEPASSLMSRLGTRHGADSITNFCRDIGFPYKALLRGDRDAIEHLARLAGCDADALGQVSIRNLGRNALRLRDEVATTHTLHRSRIRICPDCIRQDAGSAAEAWRAPRRVTWQFVSIRSCPEHNCALMPLPAETFTLHGYDFASQIQKHWQLIERAEPVPQDHTEFEEYLWRRVAGARGEAWIDQLDLNVASRACEVFGLLRERDPDSKLSGHSETEWAQFGQSGFEVLRQGADALAEEMARMLYRPGVDRRFFSRVYGPFTTWLNSRGLGEEFEPLRDLVRCRIFASFVVRRGILVLGKPSSGGDRREDADGMALNDMPANLPHLMQRRGLAHHAGDSKWCPKGFVTPAMVDALQRELSELVDIEAAATLLGLSQAEVLAQIETGTITPRLITLAGEPLFDGGMLRSWGRLAANNETGRPQHFGDRDNAALAVAAVVQRLKITPKTVFYLIENGFLCAGRISDAGRTGMAVVHSSSLAAFEDVFLSIGQLSALVRTPQGALAIRLRNAGVSMVAMPPGLSRIYWRCDMRASGLQFPDPGDVGVMNALEDAARPLLPESR